MKEDNKKIVWDKTKLIPVIGGVAGILLLIFGGILPDIGKKENFKKTDSYEVSFYTETLEKKIESLCTSVAGIDKAEVLLTLDCGTEYVYAQNEQKTSADGYNTDYIILNNGEAEGALLIMEVYPKIRGIAVVCTGGDEITTQRTIIELLSAALGVSANRIKVAGG